LTFPHYTSGFRAIDHIDRYIVGPVLEKLRTYPEW